MITSKDGDVRNVVRVRFEKLSKTRVPSPRDFQRSLFYLRAFFRKSLLLAICCYWDCSPRLFFPCLVFSGDLKSLSLSTLSTCSMFLQISNFGSSLLTFPLAQGFLFTYIYPSMTSNGNFDISNLRYIHPMNTPTPK